MLEEKEEKNTEFTACCTNCSSIVGLTDLSSLCFFKEDCDNEEKPI